MWLAIDLESYELTMKSRSLLCTCRQIRFEAQSIFYLKNRFIVQVIKCDDTLLAAFGKQRGIFAQETNLEISLSGGLSWHNLVKWCKNLRVGRSIFLRGPGLAESDNFSNDVVVVSAAHQIAFAVSLETDFQRALQALRPVACKLDSGWRPKAGQ